MESQIKEKSLNLRNMLNTDTVRVVGDDGKSYRVNADSVLEAIGGGGGGGTSNYNSLTNKPSINSITLQGNKTASDLGFSTVATSGSYSDLSNKPTIPTVITYSISISENVLTLTDSDGGTSTATLPVYSGGVS